MKNFAIFLLILIAVLALLVLSAGFILPHFISVDDYREKLQEKFADATGYQIDFEDVDLAVYPMVHANAKNVEITNGKETLAQIASINAFADPWKLIKGQVEISSVEIKSPKIYFDKKADGNNWQKAEGQNTATGNKTPQNNGAATEISIEEITVTNGALHYDDAQTQNLYKIEKLNLSTALSSLNSPISAIGSFEYSDEKFSFEGQIPNLNAEKFDASIKGLGSDLKFSGTSKAGDFTLNTNDINKLSALASQKLALPNPKVTAEGKFVLEDKQNLLNLNKITIGGSKGEGKIAVSESGKITANLNMDKVIAEDFVQENSPQSQASAANSSAGNNKLISKDLALRISLKTKQFDYKGLKLNDFNLQADIDKGEIVMQPLSFGFENGGNFEAYGIYSQPSQQQESFEGKISASGKDLYNILRSYGVDVSSFKPNALKSFSVDTDLFANIGNKTSIDAASLRLNVGQSRFSGSAQYKFGNRDEITLRGGINILNLDDLMAKKIAPTASRDIRNEAKDKRSLNFDWLKNMRPKMNIALALEKLIVNNASYDNLRAVAIAQNQKMDIQNFSVNALGTQVSGKMKINAAGKRAFIDTSLNMGYLNFPNKVETAGRGSISEKKSRWSDEEISFSPLDEIDSNFSVQIQGLKKGDLQFSNITLKGRLADSVLNISNLNTSAFGGNMSALGNIGVGVVPSFNIKIAGENLDAPTFSRQLMSNNRIISGIMNIGGTISSSGGNETSMIQNLKGGVGIGGTNIVLNGFDLENFVRKITNINNPAEVGLLATKVLNGGGQTLLTSIKGNFGIEKGIGNSSGVDIQTRVGAGKLVGQIDLPKWQMDTNADFLIDLGDQKERPKVGVRMYGALDNFKKSYDYSEVVSYYSKRFGVNEKIGDLLGDFLSR